MLLELCFIFLFMGLGAIIGFCAGVYFGDIYENNNKKRRK